MFGARPVRELIKLPRPEPSVVWLPVMVGFAALPQQTPRAVTGDPPSEVTLPPDMAVVMVIVAAAVVVTLAPPGTKVISEPYVVPSLLTPITHCNWLVSIIRLITESRSIQALH